MATVHDVAAYILERQSPMTAMKLQKLCYYAQAWHLTWEESPLFDQNFQAWANGPVSPDLYHFHRGMFQLDSWPHGKAENLTEDESESIEIILEAYGDMTAFQLSALTHKEQPWRDARVGVPDGERSHAVIPNESMLEYYSGLCAL